MSEQDPSRWPSESEVLSEYLQNVDHDPRSAYFGAKLFLERQRRHGFEARALGGLVQWQRDRQDRPPPKCVLDLAQHAYVDLLRGREPAGLVVDTVRGPVRVELPAEIWLPTSRRLALGEVNPSFAGRAGAATVDFLRSVVQLASGRPQPRWERAWVVETIENTPKTTSNSTI